MNRIVVSCVIGVGLMIPASLMAAETPLDSDEQKYSYALGYQMVVKFKGNWLQKALNWMLMPLPVVSQTSSRDKHLRSVKKRL